METHGWDEKHMGELGSVFDIILELFSKNYALEEVGGVGHEVEQNPNTMK